MKRSPDLHHEPISTYQDVYTHIKVHTNTYIYTYIYIYMYNMYIMNIYIYTLYVYIYISTSRSHSFITEFIRGAKHGAAPRCHRRHLSGVRGGCTGPGSGSHATRCGTWCLGISNVGSELVWCDLQILQSKNIQGICGQNQSHFNHIMS